MDGNLKKKFPARFVGGSFFFYVYDDVAGEVGKLMEWFAFFFFSFFFFPFLGINRK